MRSKKFGIAVFMAVTALAACGSTNETADAGAAGTALVKFNDSGCKKGETAALTAGLAASKHALLTTDGAQYEGLTCVSWDATGNTLKVDCLNFGGGCGVPWQGQAQVTDGNALNLFARHDYELIGGLLECSGAACGSCIYDWSYEVKGIDTSKDSPLTLQSGPPCDRAHDYSMTLPLATTKKGSICRYAEYGLLTWANGEMGTIHMPCRDPYDYPPDQPPTPCDEGLECTKMAPGSYRDSTICLQTCPTDADCPLDGLLKCTNGLCKLADTW